MYHAMCYKRLQADFECKEPRSQRSEHAGSESEVLICVSWVLLDLPTALIRKNEHQATIIASHIRAINKASYPFTRDPAGGLAANGIAKDVQEATDYATSLSADFELLSKQCCKR